MINMPIIGFCDNEGSLFPTLEYAETYIEPIDVENGEWEVFDASGQLLALTVQSRPTRGFWSLFSRSEEVVRIREYQPYRANRQRLRQLILNVAQNLAARGDIAIDMKTIQRLSFSELISRVDQLFDYPLQKNPQKYRS